jgi:hypothetical protein
MPLIGRLARSMPNAIGTRRRGSNSRAMPRYRSTHDTMSIMICPHVIAIKPVEAIK